MAATTEKSDLGIISDEIMHGHRLPMPPKGIGMSLDAELTRIQDKFEEHDAQMQQIQQHLTEALDEIEALQGEIKRLERAID